MDGAATGIIGGGPVADLGGLEIWWNDLAIAAWSLVLFGGFLLNATLLLAFLVRPGLRTISNRFVMNLTVSNLLTCAVLNPLLMMDSPAIGDTVMMSASGPDDVASSPTSANSGVSNVCAISEGATEFVNTCSILSVLLIAIDQYFAVVDPLRYRARIDKLKSAVLIVSVWLISAAFSLTAALNPSPRSLWLSCRTATLFLDNSSFREQIVLNATAFHRDEENEAATTPTLTRIESIRIDHGVDPIRNSTVIFHTLTNDSIVYGLIYALVHSVLAYLLPFAGICWIYVSIYSAAHRNSERTRRTGSRPILSPAASFCEDACGCAKSQHHHQQQQQQQQQSQQSIPADIAFPEEFRRIPKISSLSSIDETSETTHSANQTSRSRRSFSSVSDVPPPQQPSSEPSDEKITSSGVVFTVGLLPLEVTSSSTDERENDNAAEFGSSELPEDDQLRDPRSEDRGSHLRSSSRDLTDETGESCRWSADDTSDNDDDDDDSEDDERQRCYDYFDSLKVPTARKVIADRGSSDLSLAVVCEPREDAVIPNERDAVFEMTPPRLVVGEDGNSVAAKTETETRVLNSNSDNKRWRRPGGRRLSRSGATQDNGESRATPVGNAEINNSEVATSCLLAPIVTITPAPGKTPPGLHRVASTRSTCSYINSLKHRISNGSLFRYREETRAARVSALVIVMGLICWSPYVLLRAIKNLPRYYEEPGGFLPHEYDVLALSLLILAAYVSPLLFGYRSRRVKRELRKFFCFHRELSYKNNRSLMAKKVLKRRHSNTLSHLEMDHRYNIFNCVYGRNRWPKEKVQFVQVPDTALAVETCRSSFSSGASTQISSTSTDEC